MGNTFINAGVPGGRYRRALTKIIQQLFHSAHVRLLCGLNANRLCSKPRAGAYVRNQRSTGLLLPANALRQVFSSWFKHDCLRKLDKAARHECKNNVNNMPVKQR